MANLLGTVKRNLPGAVPDLTDNVAVAQNRYGAVKVEAQSLGVYSPADEGTYFVVNNGQAAAIANSTAVAFVATTPAIIIQNNWTPGDPSAKRMYLDYVNLLESGTFTLGTSVQMAVVIDSIARFSAGGAELTANIVNVNGDSGLVSKARVFVGALTAVAAGSGARQVIGQRLLKAAIGAINDVYVMTFLRQDNYELAPGAFTHQNLPPVIIPPGGSALIYLWQPAATASGASQPEIGWIER